MVDVGSTSVHLLVAAISGHTVEPLADESTFLGLGAASASGSLGPDLRAELVSVLVGYAERARATGATGTTFVGTEPLRRASDATSAALEVERATGLPLHVLSHEEEGLLTLLGVTSGHPVTVDLLVVDVGGGSSEFVVAGPDRAPSATGLRLGAATLTSEIVRGDPPAAAEMEAMRAFARSAVAPAPDAAPREIVAVGGTASNLLKILPAAARDRMLSRRRLGRAIAVLMAEPAAVAATRHAVNPTRARILPAGAAILEAVLSRYGAQRLLVSDAGIREGLALATAHAGRGWRGQLVELARGWAD